MLPIPWRRRSTAKSTEAFEGLGLGTRLAFLQLPAKWDWVPTAAALVYSAMTPLGMAIGLGAQGGLVSFPF
jgi:zinc transporter 1/2/3